MIARPEVLIERASDRTGFSDFGPSGWKEGLDRLVDAIDLGDDPETVGRFEELMLGRLVRRLRVENWLGEHPGDAEGSIEGPVMIVGLPRTGTTALQYLLSSDPQFRYPRRWEVDNPVPPPEVATESEDPRRVPRHSDAQHIRTVDGPNEDGPIFDMVFRSPETVLPARAYTQWWLTADPRVAYDYHERILKLLQSRRPPHLWLLKYPAFMFHLPELAVRYPNARFIMTHRDPAAILLSTCSVVLSSRQRRVPGLWPDFPTFGREILDFFAEGAHRAVADRAAIGEERFLDVAQHETVTDPLRVAERIYDFAGLELRDDVRGAFAWKPEQQPGARGSHGYSADDFGLSPEGIREAFAEYLEKYGAYCGRAA